MYSINSFKQNSCLSPAVKELFEISVTHSTEPCLIFKNEYEDRDKGFSDTSHLLLLNWSLIHKKICDSSKNIDHVHSIRQLAPFLTYIMQHYGSLTPEEFSSHLEWTKWTHCENVFHHCWRLLVAKEDQCDVLLATLLLTAYFEHALGNVFLIKGKNVPFLMKDLLATQELLETLGPEPVQVLKLIMGTPSALNLRNILWHGFMSPTEIDPRYGFFLIAAAVALGFHLQATYKKIPKRNVFNFENSKVLTDFTENVNTNELRIIFEQADTLPQMKFYFYHSLNLFDQNRFNECVVILLPNLECTLRYLFASANHCADRILTAESDTFYTTFDEMLSKEYGKDVKNCLVEKLNGNLFEMLLDVLNYQQGPRVRDRISHGEVPFNVVPRELASHLLHLSACLCLQASNHEKQSQYATTIIKASQDYKAHFHPTSLLISKVKELVSELLCWDTALNGTVKCIENQSKLPPLNCLPEVFSNLGLNKSFLNCSEMLSTGQVVLESVSPLTLFRPRQELEAISALHHATINTVKASVNIRSSLQDKHEKFMNRQLRSRQRENYQKLLRNWEDMYLGLIYLSYTLLYFLKNINLIGEFDVKDYQQLLKFLKKIVQCSENLDVLSSSENNDWDGILEIQVKFLKQLTDFNLKSPLRTFL